jgi:hypothetical protein
VSAHLDARLHLLDRQILDADGDPSGIVDDLEIGGVEFGRPIDRRSPAPRVTALLCGQVVGARILGGSSPRSRLQEVPWRLVAAAGVTVRLTPTDMVIDAHWVERWLRDHVVGRIPGGHHAGQ